MKNIMKRFLSFSLALIIFCFTMISSVSADTVTGLTDAELLSDGWIFNNSINTYKNFNYFRVFMKNFKSYGSLSDYVFTIKYYSSSTPTFRFFSPKFKLENDDYVFYADWRGSTCYYSYQCTDFTPLESFDFSTLSSYNIPNILAPTSFVSYLVYRKTDGVCYSGRTQSKNLNTTLLNYNTSSDLSSVFEACKSLSWYDPNSYLFPFLSSNLDLPDIDNPKEKYYNLYGIDVRDIDKQGFLQWFASNNKIDDIKDCGLNIASENVEYLFDFWNKYKGHPLKMLANLPFLCFHLGLTSITYDCITSVAHRLDDLYLEYEQYLLKNASQQIEYKGPHPHWRNTDDSEADYTLTTDTTEDDTLISLLREILRTLIVMPEQISIYFSYLSVYLDSILIDFNRLLYFIDSLPSYIADSMQIKFTDDIQTIIDAINNISVDVPETPDTTINVEIPDAKQTEVNLFFSDWNTRFTNKINEKVPVIGQLSELFNDEFFEKCGIDTNGDGETYSYVTYSNLGTVSEGGSFGVSDTPKTDDANFLVNKFVGQFPGADAHYLDTVEYSGDIPHFTVNVGGQECEIVNTKLYAKYRIQIHAIIIFILYIGYFLSLFKSIPRLIGNVADVTNAVNTTSDDKNGDD